MAIFSANEIRTFFQRKGRQNTFEVGDGTRCDLHIKFPDICYLTFKNLIYHSDYFSGIQIHDHSGCLQLEDEESHFDP